ncbi:MAG: queuosine salvage family protein [Ardenticatenaceae bacterium]|nr:queuosine salvage family protein [Ardenticatenaceae bacterium]
MPINPLTAVRATTGAVVRLARHVHIDPLAVERVARELADHRRRPAGWDDVHHFRDGGPLTVQYLLVLDTLNFCFWPAPEWDYQRLALALKRATDQDPGWLDADRLSRLTGAELTGRLGGALPLLDERVRLLREAGAVLDERWGGQAAALVEAAHGSAAALVALVAAEFPGFRDHAIYEGKQIFFYKRAQIFVGDLWGSFAGELWGSFDDIGDLTMFADYRVPQLLRERRVLRYGPRLAAAVDTGRLIPAGSDFEVELRAATVQAVELLREHLEGRGHPLTSLTLDWLLWQEGEARQRELKPHHRTLTIFY